MASQRFIDDVYRLAAKALASGATRVSQSVIDWNVSGPCTNPWTTTYWGRPSRDDLSKKVVIKRGSAHTLFIDMHTACHKCEKCLEARARLWTARATQEITDSVRTWYGTLTLSPDVHHTALLRARAREWAQGVDYETLPQSERWALLVAQIQLEHTKYLKRIRSETLQKCGLRDVPSVRAFRYLLVTERHASGVPHFHMLVHEVSPDIPVRKRTLDWQYRLGLVRQWRLVDDTYPAGYVSKYLSKDALSRVRASLGYGNARSRIGDIHL